MYNFDVMQRNDVSLFTREWIEISPNQYPFVRTSSPSLRGSGLKYLYGFSFDRSGESPSLRGSGLKCSYQAHEVVVLMSPSLRGSGLKLKMKQW